MLLFVDLWGRCPSPLDSIAQSIILGFGAMYVTKPYKFIGFEAMDVTKPYTFIGFGAMGYRVWCHFPCFAGVPAFLHRSVNYFRFLGFLLCFVLGPGAPGGPRGPGKAHG